MENKKSNLKRYVAYGLFFTLMLLVIVYSGEISKYASKRNSSEVTNNYERSGLSHFGLQNAEYSPSVATSVDSNASRGFFDSLFGTNDSVNYNQSKNSYSSNSVNRIIRSESAGGTLKNNNAGQYRTKSAFNESNLDKAKIGFKAGNDQDIQLFRENILNGHIPNPDVLTYNGVFGDYHFDLPEGKCEDMFCPLIGAGKTNVDGNDDEKRIQVGLGSNIAEEDFKRPPTNFIFVVDVSGSMSSPLGSYYYNGDIFDEEWEYCQTDDIYFKPSKRCIKNSEKPYYEEEYNRETRKTKIKLAKDSLSDLVEKLDGDDRIGVVLFSDTGKIAHPLVKVSNVDINKLKQHIQNMSEGGGTNMEQGMQEGLKLLNDDIANDDGYQNRVVFITDAMPNIGNDSPYSLGGMVEEAVNKGIYFTFVGVGVDFQQQFIQKLSKHKGTNYFFIGDAWGFRNKLVDEFDYNFFPMIFGLEFSTDDADKIEKVYGVDSTLIENEGKIMSINTLFPTPPTDEGYRGSIILFKLKDDLSDDLEFDVSFEKVGGEKVESRLVLSNDKFNSEGSKSMNKGVVLVKYIDGLKRAVIDDDESILATLDNLFENNDDLFDGDDEDMMKEELEVIDKLADLIENGEQIKRDYWQGE